MPVCNQLASLCHRPYWPTLPLHAPNTYWLPLPTTLTTYQHALLATYHATTYQQQANQINLFTWLLCLFFSIHCKYSSRALPLLRGADGAISLPSGSLRIYLTHWVLCCWLHNPKRCWTPERRSGPILLCYTSHRKPWNMKCSKKDM